VSFVGNERGVVLIMALMVMLLLSIFVVAFLTLSTSDVTLANNQLSNAQARALAESGVEWSVAQINTVGGSPWVVTQSLEVGGVSVGTFTTVPTWLSATAVSVVSTAATTGPRPAKSTCRVTLVQDGITGRWAMQPGTWRQ
jgi:Tfp pilus assembly protein PilX